jgi:hypothetical protein
MVIGASTVTKVTLRRFIDLQFTQNIYRNCSAGVCIPIIIQRIEYMMDGTCEAEEV